MPVVARPDHLVVTQPDHLAAWLTLAGAIVVALIAAGTAQWRQRSALKAESERLKLQLAHDRALTDLSELRSVLDAGVAAAHGVLVAINAYAGSPESRLGAEQVLRGALDEDLFHVLSRTQARLGRDHPVSRELDRLDTAGREAVRRMKSAGPERVSLRALGSEDVAAAYVAFVTAVKATVGSRIESAPKAEATKAAS